MTNTALNTRTTSAISASAAQLAGVTSVERCGVVLRRSEYTLPRHVPVQSPLISTHDSRRVVFMVRLDGGVGSEMVTIDQTLDAVSALINENDQVSVTLVDDVHVESTVAPIFPWTISSESNVAGRELRRGEYLNSKGVPCVASLILGDDGLVVVSSGCPAHEIADGISERCGVILLRSVYSQPRHMPLIAPHAPKDVRRVAFVVRLDGGVGSEIVTIDQTLDATSVLLRENDQVTAKLVDHVHVESTVQPIFGWAEAGDDDTGRILRIGEFDDSKGLPSMATLLLGEGPSQGLMVRTCPVQQVR